MKEIKLYCLTDYYCSNLRGGSPYIHEEYTTETKDELSLKSCYSVAGLWLKGILTKHCVAMEDVTFLPEDTLEHANTQGLPCYMFHTGDDTGTHTYHLSTTFIK